MECACDCRTNGAGDTLTWTASEADAKLIISHFIGGRDGASAEGVTASEGKG